MIGIKERRQDVFNTGGSKESLATYLYIRLSNQCYNNMYLLANRVPLRLVQGSPLASCCAPIGKNEASACHTSTVLMQAQPHILGQVEGLIPLEIKLWVLKKVVIAVPANQTTYEPGYLNHLGMPSQQSVIQEKG